LANLASAITSPGDVILVPNPSYPIHQFGFIIADGAVRNVPVVPDQDFFKAVESAIMHSVPKPKALVLNYPNNPTGYTCSLEFYEQAVDFCRHHEIWILSDIAYSELYFDGVPPPSILQVPRAKEIAVEFSSMSKTYSMPGWRIGFAAGNKHLISALTRIKSYLDYGAFTPIQVAATAALNGPQDCVDEIRALYKGRRDTLIESMAQAGWDIPAPPATMFAWAPVPPAFRHLGSNEFAKLLLTEAQVAVSPGVAFGEHGDGFVRIGLVENRQRIRQAARNVKAFLTRYDKVLEESERRRAVAGE
jgi:alanine-synthesizing transaminase